MSREIDDHVRVVLHKTAVRLVKKYVLVYQSTLGQFDEPYVIGDETYVLTDTAWEVQALVRPEAPRWLKTLLTGMAYRVPDSVDLTTESQSYAERRIRQICLGLVFERLVKDHAEQLELPF